MTCLPYKKGDTLIHERHGTDHSWNDAYIITEIWVNEVGLSKNPMLNQRHSINRYDLDNDLASEYPQFRIVPQCKPVKLDEDLFTL